MTHVTHVLDGLAVFDADGRSVHLESLWADRTALFVFVRHFGCVFCRQQVDGFSPLLESFRALGIDLFVVGSGSVEEARAFRDERRTAIPILTDPSRRSYEVLGMRRGLASVFTAGTVARGLRAARAGFRQSRVAGDALQQGGVIAIAPGGVERFRFISKEAGHHPEPVKILETLRNA